MLGISILIDIICVIILVDHGISFKCPKQVHDSSNYIGCFVDSEDRLLPHLYTGMRYHFEIENNICILYCKGQGYKYAGTQEHRYCFCGNNLFRNGTENGGYHLQNHYCFWPCIGDSSQLCGGAMRLSVYETGFHPLNSQNTVYKEFAKDYKLTTETKRVIRMSSVSHCAMHCLSSISCRAFEVCRETAECSLIFDYETLCDGIQHGVGYVIYMLQ